MGVASLASITTPVLLHAMQQGQPSTHVGLSPTAAGTAMTAELLAMAVSTMAASRLLPLGRRIAIVGCVGAAAMTALSGSLLTDVASFVLCRLAAGICMGLVAAGANSQLSISSSPDRLSALGVISTTAIGVVALLTFPIIGERGGAVAVFGALSSVYAVALIAAWRLQPVDAAPVPRLPGSHPGWGLVAALCLLNLSDSMIYSASEVMARRAGLVENAYSFVLAGAAIAGVAAAGLAASLNLRAGRRAPVAGALTLKAAASLALVFVSGTVVFSTVDVLIAVAHFFAIPFLFGATAQVDRSGRTAVLGAGAFQVGGAIGPLVSVTLASYAGPLAVGAASSLCLLFAWRAGRAQLVRLDALAGSDPPTYTPNQ